jgi:threonine aldolase
MGQRGQSLIDLRSDTSTRPTKEMRAAIAAAEVGDDVLGDDPTINLLEEKLAALLGKEAALFVPSGTMSNQIAVKVHTQPGDEMLCETTCHIYTWEAGGPAVLSGVTCRTVDGADGLLDVDQLRPLIRPDDQHYVRTRLVTLENTHNRGGGRVYPQEKIEAIAKWASENGLAMHLDGARLWNAHIASGLSLAELSNPFDTISVCFSKGLGAPVGSGLAGSKDFIAKARRVRKLFGGGMRQGGIVAAGALYALENHIERLVEDHRNAQIIAEAIRDTPGLKLVPEVVETNLVWFEIDPTFGTSTQLADKLRDHHIVLHNSYGTTLRACTHLDVSKGQAEYVAETIRKVAR